MLHASNNLEINYEIATITVATALLHVGKLLPRLFVASAELDQLFEPESTGGVGALMDSLPFEFDFIAGVVPLRLALTACVIHWLVLVTFFASAIVLQEPYHGVAVASLCLYPTGKIILRGSHHFSLVSG